MYFQINSNTRLTKTFKTGEALEEADTVFGVRQNWFRPDY